MTEADIPHRAENGWSDDPTPSWVDESTAAAARAPYGSKVRYKTKTESGEGTLTLVWYGVTEVLNVTRPDGSRVYVYPELGETAEVCE